VPTATRPAPIATKFHLAGLLLLLFGVAAAGFFAQHQAAAASSAAPLASLPTTAKRFSSTCLHSSWTGDCSTAAMQVCAVGVERLPHSRAAAGRRPRMS
jgi:hypothetical protein